MCHAVGDEELGGRARAAFGSTSQRIGVDLHRYASGDDIEQNGRVPLHILVALGMSQNRPDASLVQFSDGVYEGRRPAARKIDLQQHVFGAVQRQELARLEAFEEGPVIAHFDARHDLDVNSVLPRQFVEVLHFIGTRFAGQRWACGVAAMVRTPSATAICIMPIDSASSWAPSSTPAIRWQWRSTSGGRSMDAGVSSLWPKSMNGPNFMRVLMSKQRARDFCERNASNRMIERL